MSAGDDSGPGRREVAYRLFAAEFDDATVSYAESDEERAPKYVVTPTGARVNRLFAVGVLTEVESVNEDVLRARVVDPTGAFVSYAGQYQPDAAASFERTDPPAFVALTGKARTFEPEDGDRVYTSVRPESVSTVDGETRDRWTVSAAAATLRRVAAMADARSMDERGDDLEAALQARGYDESLAAGIPIALDRYATTVAYLDAVRQVALDALETVAGERDEVRALDVAPDDAGTTSLGPLPEAVRAGGTPAEADGTGGAQASERHAAAAEGEAAEPESEPEPKPESGSTIEPTADTDTDERGGFDDGDGVGGSTDSGGDLGTFDDGSDDLGGPTDSGEDTDEFGESTDSGDELGDFDDGGDDIYELDEEERREVEAEFDVGFESGAEVDDPGEADIDVPGPEELDEAESADADGTAADTPAEADADGTAADTPAEADTDGTAADTPAEADADGTAADTPADEPTDDVDLEDAAVDAMAALDGGDGAPHDEVVAAVVEEYGADPGAVADAIEDALMSGKCYEPSEDRLKAI